MGFTMASEATSKQGPVSQIMFQHYNKFLDDPVDFDSIDEPFGLFFPRFDYWISYRSVVGGDSIDSLLSRAAKGGLLSYLRRAAALGFLGRFGLTADPASYIINFPTTKTSLLWIPKNSCTTAKQMLLSFEPAELTEGIAAPVFHERCQEQFGIKRVQFANNRLFPLVCVLRHPLERLVSCYLDKFAKPVISGRPFERFILPHIRAAHDFLEVDGPVERSITFSEFVHYIRSTPAWALDAHWRPQTCFVQGFAKEATFITTSNLSVLYDLLGLERKDLKFNRSFGGRYRSDAVNDGQFAHYLPAQLKDLEMEYYNQFLNKDIYEIVRGVYREDLDLVARIEKNER